MIKRTSSFFLLPTTALPIVLLTFITGCGGGNGDASGDIVTAEPTIVHSFATAVPSSSAVPLPISPYQDNGVFTVAWSVTASTDPFHVDVYVSNDAELQTSTDYRIISQNCGSATIFDCSEGPATATCTFDTDNRVSCAMPTTDYPTVTNLSSFLASLPKSAYLILHACDAQINESCADAVRSVEFQ